MINKLPSINKVLINGLLLFYSSFSIANSVIEAEHYDDMFGIQLENNSTTVGYIDVGDWILYRNVDFSSSFKSIIFNVAKASSGGHLELRIDTIDGALIANFYPESTNSWAIFEDQMCNISEVTGVHNLYFIAKDVNGVCNIDWFTFSDTEVYVPNWLLFWSDEFDGDDLDESVWTKFHDGNPHNGELQFYTPREENIVVSNGTLKLIARKETYTGQGPWMTEPVTRYYTSGKVESQGKLTFQYGKIEARMKLPRGKGTWPAFWMLGENLFNEDVGWPKCGEIDIMEHGQDFDNLGAAIHTEAYNHTIGTQRTGTYIISDYDTNFHTYGVEWTESELKFYVDDNYYFSVTKDQIGSSESEWPFDQPFWLILNHAVGGAWGGTPDDSLFPHVTEVDWVRVYRDSTLSISDDQSNISNITIYPNPGTDNFWLETGIRNEKVNIEIYDINGRLIKSLSKNIVDKILINISDLNKGFYIINVKTNKVNTSMKFIKE